MLLASRRATAHANGGEHQVVDEGARLLEYSNAVKRLHMELQMPDCPDSCCRMLPQMACDDLGVGRFLTIAVALPRTSLLGSLTVIDVLQSGH